MVFMLPDDNRITIRLSEDMIEDVNKVVRYLDSENIDTDNSKVMRYLINKGLEKVRLEGKIK